MSIEKQNYNDTAETLKSLYTKMRVWHIIWRCTWALAFGPAAGLIIGIYLRAFTGPSMAMSTFIRRLSIIFILAAIFFLVNCIYKKTALAFLDSVLAEFENDKQYAPDDAVLSAAVSIVKEYDLYDFHTSRPLKEYQEGRVPAKSAQ